MKSDYLPHIIRLLIIGDNRLLREGLTEMINAQPDIEVVGALGRCENILRRVHETTPHVVLLDLSFRNQDSLGLVQLAKEKRADVELILMGVVATQTGLIDFVQAGVSGFLLHQATLEDFLQTIRLVADGTKVLPQALTRPLFSEIVHMVQGSQSLLLPAAGLTKRELEIVELIADGLTNKEIAQRLNLATFTVKTHVHNIFEKLALHTRVQVASYYARSKATSPAHLDLAGRTRGASRTTTSLAQPNGRRPSTGRSPADDRLIR
jgi:DNA-binding NarL/FixJ family response regulator